MRYILTYIYIYIHINAKYVCVCLMSLLEERLMNISRTRCKTQFREIVETVTVNNIVKKRSQYQSKL